MMHRYGVFRSDDPDTLIASRATRKGAALLAQRLQSKAHHYVSGSGSVGCWYDYGPNVTETLEEAIAGFEAVFGHLSSRQLRRMRSDLRSSGIHYFPSRLRTEAGADYCKVSLERGLAPIEGSDEPPHYAARKLETPVYKPSRGPLAKQWRILAGDINWTDYGAMWGRPSKTDPARWFVIQFENTAEWGDDAADHYGKYHASLSEVNLISGQLAKALEFVGFDQADLDANEPAVRSAMKAEALASYGAKAPLEERSGNAAFRMLAELAAAARDLENDPAAHAAALERPVNAIGSTAAEYAAGDTSAILRGLEAGDQRAEILAKMGMLR